MTQYKATYIGSTPNENNRGITFEEYERFIYLNTHLTKDEAREYARDAWNLGLTKTEAIVAL